MSKNPRCGKCGTFLRAEDTLSLTVAELNLSFNMSVVQ
jgi:hypothetical protein